MTKYHKKQIGSTRTFIIVILSILLALTLGFIVWQNFIKADPEDSTISDKDSSLANNADTSETDAIAESDKYAGWGGYASTSHDYSFKYPSDWLLRNDIDYDGVHVANMDLDTVQSNGGYPDGYIRLAVSVYNDDANFQAMAGSTVGKWYNSLGNSPARLGAVTHESEDVRAVTVNGVSAKSAKAVFTETSENIYILKGGKLYSVSIFPYNSSSNATVKQILDSFTLL